MNKLLELDAKKIIYGKSAEVSEKVDLLKVMMKHLFLQTDWI